MFAVKAGAAPVGPAAGVVLDLARSAADEGEARAWADDTAFLAWAEGGGGASVIAAELKACSTGPFTMLQDSEGLKAQCMGPCTIVQGSDGAQGVLHKGPYCSLRYWVGSQDKICPVVLRQAA